MKNTEKKPNALNSNETLLKENFDDKLSIKENNSDLTGATSSSDNSQKKQTNNGNSATNPDERCVTITGYDFQVYKVKF